MNATKEVKETLKELKEFLDLMKETSSKATSLRKNTDDVNDLMIGTIITSIHTLSSTINVLTDRIVCMENEIDLLKEAKKITYASADNDFLKEITESM